MINTADLFPTRVAWSTVELEDSERASIVDHIRSATSAQESRSVRSSLLSAGSRFLDDFPNLAQRLQTVVDEYTQSLGLVDNIISYSWGNSYAPGANILPHRHEFTVLSGAYYVWSDGDAGDIAVETPLSYCRVNEIAQSPNSYNTRIERIPVGTGAVVVFPSWLNHWSERNTSQQRYVIGFDATSRSREF